MSITSGFSDTINNVGKGFGLDIDEIKNSLEDEDLSTTEKLKSIDKNGTSAVADTLDSINNLTRRNRVDTRSIIARSRNSVMQFPVYISQSVPVNPAHVIARLYDRVYASFAQALLSMNPVISETEANNLVFLKRYHHNITEAVEAVINEYTTPIDDIDSMIQESVFYRNEITPGCILECAWVPMSDPDIIAESGRCVNDILAGFPYLAEAGKRIEKEVQWQDIKKDELDQLLGEMYPDITDTDDARKQFQTDVMIANMAKHSGVSKIDPMNRDRYNELKDQHRLDALTLYTVTNGHFRKKISKVKNVEDYTRTTIDAPVLLKDGDIKRSNGMIPWTIQATFRVKDGKGNPGYDVKFIIGIKSVLHLISPKDLASELRELIMGNEKGLQKVRYKTGEITFMNYLLNMEGLKKDAGKRIRYNKRWINTLKRLAEYRKRNGSIKLSTKSDAIPNATLVLTHQDVINLANETGIDLSSVGNAKRLARSLFLVSIAILDSTAGTLRVLFPDRDSDWDVQSISSIDAELAKTDNSKMMSELNRLINKR